jgi:hypothetical protein
MTTSQLDLERTLRRIDELDLEPIAYKLVHPQPGETNMTIDEADRLVIRYRRFLQLCAMYPERGIVPSKEIDPVWHEHILDTSKYRADCMAIFGFVLDHFPYLGSRGPQDEASWKQKFAETRNLYRQHFGEDMVGTPTASSAICQSRCDGGGCEDNPDGGPDNPFTGERERPRLVRI